MIGDKRAVEPLINAFKDVNSFFRINVAMALGEIGDARAVEPLTQALKDKDESVQKAAKKALDKIKHR